MTIQNSFDPDIDRVGQMLADAARAVILPFFRAPDLMADNKLDQDYDPVTEADRAAERVMRAILQTERPNDAILGEEYGEKPGTSGLTWVLDPIDGTRGFVAGTPNWGVLIAVWDATGPIYGILDQPYIGERFLGHPEHPQLISPHGTRPLKTRPPRDLSEAIVFTTFPEVGSAAEGTAFHAVADQALLTRYGMDCYAYGLVASGQVDLVIEAGLQAYDISAPIAIIQAAGGIVTDWSGAPAHKGGRALAAANAEIHAQALAILQASMGDALS